MKPIQIAAVFTVLVISGVVLAEHRSSPESALLQAARRAAEASPRDRDAQAALGESLLQAGRLGEATKVFAKVRRLKGGRVAGLHGIARVKMAREDYHGARATCKQVLAAAKGSPEGHSCTGFAFLAWRRNSRASDNFEKALAIDSSYAPALVGLAECERNRVNYAKAEGLYRKALAADGRSALAHLGLGSLYIAQDKMSAAVQELRAAVQTDPDLAEAHHKLGIALGATAEGIAAHRKSVEIRPEWPLGLEALGQALSGRGQHDEAVRVLERAVQLQDNLVGAHVALAEAQAGLDHWPGAEASLRKAIEIVPNMPRAVTLLGRVQAEQGLHDEAIETLLHAADLAPANALVPLRIGRIHRLMSHNTQAIAQFRRSAQLDGDLAAPEAELGDIYFERSMWSQARQHYEAAVARSNQQGVDTAQVRSRLQQLRSR